MVTMISAYQLWVRRHKEETAIRARHCQLVDNALITFGPTWFPPMFFPISYLHTCISPLCSFLFTSYIFVMAGKYRLKRRQRHNGPRLVYTYLIKWLPNSINNLCPNINFIITQSRQYLQKRWLLEPETDVQSKPSYYKLGIFNNQSHLSLHFCNTTEERPIAPKALVILCNQNSRVVWWIREENSIVSESLQFINKGINLEIFSLVRLE